MFSIARDQKRGFIVKRYISYILILLLHLSSFHYAYAERENDMVYDRVNFSVTASDQVENDLLVAILYTEKQGTNASALAAEVNETVHWALAQVKDNTAIKFQTMDYRTNPVYRKQTLSGWEVRQSLRLESAEATVLSELLGALQERLAIQSIDYQLSPKQRRLAEDRLINEALAAFEQRAQQITQQLKRPGYRLVKLQIRTDEHSRPPVLRAMAMEARSASTPPAFVPGEQRLTVEVAGTIELQLD